MQVSVKEDRQKWIVRLILGLVVTAIVAFFYTK